MLKFLKIIMVVTVVLYCFKSNLYNLAFRYELVNKKNAYSVDNKFFIQEIDENATKYFQISAVENTALRLSSEKLDFKLESKEINPNKLYETGEANCIGYSAYVSSICNYLFEKNKVADVWRADFYTAKIYFFGFCIHRLFKDKSYKDHDITVITNMQTGEQWGIDASLYDWIGIGKVKIKE